MEGTVAPGKLSGRTPALRFELAGPADDAGLRRLLRESPMDGAIRVTHEREPAYFVGAGIACEEHQTVLCRDQAGALLGLGTREVRLTCTENEPSRTGYLSQLRLAASARGGFHLVTRGYALLKRLHDEDGRTPVYLTGIMEDNAPARRLLESGLRGLPHYLPLDRFETSIIAAPPSRRRVRALTRLAGVAIRTATPGDLPAVASLLESVSREGKYAFAHAWTAARLQSLSRWNLPIEQFILAESRGKLVACAALWDQHAFRQSVIRGYPPALARWRRVLNLAGRVLSRLVLPPVGSPLPLVYLSHAAALPRHADAFAAVAAHGASIASRGGGILVAGFAAAHPLAPVMRGFSRRTLASILYGVYWADGAAHAAALKSRPIHAEVALL